MKIAIIYKSVLGSTKKYAQWIADEYKADLFTYNSATNENIQKYDLIIVASGTYASLMPLTGFLKKHWDVLRNKRVLALAVGMAHPDDPQSYAQYELIPAHIQDEIHYHKLPGKLIKAGPAGEPSKDKLLPVFKIINRMLNE